MPSKDAPAMLRKALGMVHAALACMLQYDVQESTGHAAKILGDDYCCFCLQALHE